MSNKEVLDVVVLIDKSASMGGMEEETIGAFNSFLQEQRNLEIEAYLTLILFDHEKECIYFREPLDRAEELTSNIYKVRGNTAMYDCMGLAIEAIALANKSDNVLFLIQSDGQENSSRMYSGSNIKQLISDSEKAGWQFNFIGTGIDAFEEGSKFGLRANSCLSVAKSARGFETYGATMDCCTKAYVDDVVLTKA
ncbi:MAG: VWA domain-containing protein [Desulfobacterales bacterium]|nr:VWA domain-containing protein [Desulfobacterales bacterium]